MLVWARGVGGRRGDKHSVLVDPAGLACLKKHPDSPAAKPALCKKLAIVRAWAGLGFVCTECPRSSATPEDLASWKGQHTPSFLLCCLLHTHSFWLAA